MNGIRNRIKLLIIDDDASLRTAMATYLRAQGFDSQQAGTVTQGLNLFQATSPEVVLLDYCLPDGDALRALSQFKAMDASVPVVVLTGHGTIDLAVRAVKEGAEQFLTKPLQLQALAVVLQKAVEHCRNERKQAARATERPRYDRNPFLGTSAAIRHLEDAAHLTLTTKRPILLQGETGTGKGVLATWLHQNGARSHEPFVDLNCAGLSRELVESELFGYEKGAFTGAVNRKLGLLEAAHRGTLFLDEIGDLDYSVQPKLLKVLEDNRFRRLGEVRERIVDIQLIAATHANLSEAVAERKFRRDLYFRINTIPLCIPPLRERREDIPALVAWLLDRLSSDLGRCGLQVEPEAMAAMQQYDWPGNVRELRNVLERAALTCRDSVLRASHLRFELSTPSRNNEFTCVGTLRELEQRYIQFVLTDENGSVVNAANRLGIPRSTLYAKMKQYKLLPAQARKPRSTADRAAMQ